jgi:ketosteroid isomerase-like protein
MGAAENKEMIRNMWTELSKGNTQGFLNNFADNCRITIIGASKFSGTWTNKQDFVSKVAKPLSALLAGGVAVTIDNLIAEGDYVVMQSRGKSNTKAGGTYNNTYCQVFRLANGKV